MDRRDILTIPILTAILAALVAATPDEQALGSLLKFIYLHGGIATTGLALFVLTGISGLLFLLLKNRVFLEWSRTLKRVGLGCWVLYLLSSLVVAKLAWGGVFWGEPRLMAGISILLTVAAIMAVSAVYSSDRIEAVSNIMTTIAVVWLRLRAGLIIHPESPVTMADEAAIKLYFYSIAVTIFFIALEITRMMVKIKRQDDLRRQGRSNANDE